MTFTAIHSPQEKGGKKYSESVAAFLEESIVRRELADNFCYYQENYDNLKGCYEWARKTLNDHKKDKRDHLYTLKQLEEAQTHDDLWNAAQLQMVNEGKMHGFLRYCMSREPLQHLSENPILLDRMYWAKKILEWTESPERALEIAIYLNDRYELDGRDPSGYVGCMWSIGGIHDQGWAERKIFGKIRFIIQSFIFCLQDPPLSPCVTSHRYMTYDGCKRKFDINAFIGQHKREKQ